jgi:hypothetical protein
MPTVSPDEVLSMKRSMCGGFLLAGMIVLGGCSGDPTGDLVGSGTTLQPTPSSLFMGQGEEKAIVVNVVDAQGNQQDLTGFSFQGGAGVTVTEDTTFLSTSAGQLGTSRRLFVRGDAASATSVSITANTLTSTVPVKVTPVGTTVTLSNAAPAANEGLVITLPAGYKFGTGAGASVAGTPGFTTAVAPDSTSATVLLPPGTTGPVTVDSVAVDFVPGVLFSLPTTETVTVGPVTTALAGTDDPSTAPSLALPAAGGTTAVFDIPDFAATIDHFYRLDVAEAGDYIVTVDWTVGNDVDAPVCIADPTCAAETFTDPTVTGAKPETGTFTLPAGTSILWVEDFGAIQDQFGLPPGVPAVGATLTIVISRP